MRCVQDFLAFTRGGLPRLFIPLALNGRDDLACGNFKGAADSGHVPLVVAKVATHPRVTGNATGRRTPRAAKHQPVRSTFDNQRLSIGGNASSVRRSATTSGGGTPCVATDTSRARPAAKNTQITQRRTVAYLRRLVAHN